MSNQEQEKLKKSQHAARKRLLRHGLNAVLSTFISVCPIIGCGFLGGWISYVLGDKFFCSPPPAPPVGTMRPSGSDIAYPLGIMIGIVFKYVATCIGFAIGILLSSFIIMTFVSKADRVVDC